MNLGLPKEQLFDRGNILNQLTVDQAFRLAGKKAKAGQVNEARKIYDDILEKFPKNKRALQALNPVGFTSFQKKSVSNDPPNSILVQIVELFNSGQFRQALESSVELLENFPNSALLHNFCGGANAELGRYDVAVIGYKNAVSIQPDYTDAFYNMGAAQKELGQLEEAKLSYETVLKLDAKHSNAWNNLGIIYEEQGSFDKALKSFEKSTLYDKNHIYGHFNKANRLRGDKRFKEAITSYKIVLRINPDFFEANCSLGALFKDQGDFEKAIEHYNKAISTKPDHAEAHFLLGNAKMEIFESNEALDHFRDAIDLKNNYPQAYANMGDIYYSKDYIDEAIASYKAAFQLDPESVDNLCNLAAAHKSNSELDVSIKYYRKALEIEPERAITLSALAAVLYDNGQKKEAMEAFNLAIKKDPKSEAVLLNYGTTLDNDGEPDKAIEIYKKALSLNPDYALAHRNIGFVYLFQGDLERAIVHRNWRWKDDEGQRKIRHLKLPEWDGNQSLKGKRVLALGEQGPGDVIIWAPGLDYLKTLGAKITLQCHAKLVELFKMSFTGVEIKPADNKKTIGTDEYDYYIPMETLFGYFCISEQKRDKSLNLSAPAQFKTDTFLFPKQERIDFWKKRLNKIGNGPFVGISWKSPKITYARKKNYTELSDWQPLFSLTNITFINLQSKNFEDDLLEIKKKYSIDVHNFDDLDHYDDFADVAALCAALDVCVSISTAVSTVAAAVGTPTKMLQWRRSSWNNVLFSPTGPNVKIYEKDTWESWDNSFNLIAKELKNIKN